MVKLKQLVKDLENVVIKGSKEVEISGLSSHSKQVAPGDLYIAKKGLKTHGMEYIKDACLAGAKAVVSDFYNPFYKEMTQIICEDVSLVEAILAKKFYQDPSKDLFLCGITGTNGKTTTAYLIQHLLSQGKTPCGLIGTVEIITGKMRTHARMTTPDVIAVNRFLKEMVNSHLKAAVMEVSSHALDQGRTRGIEFDHVVFTHITHDHLDYHGSFENYVEAKSRLFLADNHVKQKRATVNSDCPYAERMSRYLPTHRVSLNDPKADFFVSSYQLMPEKTLIEFHHLGKSYTLESPLIGLFNIYNVMLAVSVARAKGMTFAQIDKRLKLFPQVPGRMQRLEGFDMSVYIDYAHTEDALEKVLKTLKAMSFSKIILVFGCGGDRDQAKRKKMGQVAALYADKTILTSDNPRHEDPQAIIDMIASGMAHADMERQVDRKEAIFRALSMAKPADCVLIAGKGHENYQIFQNKTVEFNDAEIALSFLNRSKGPT